MPIDKTKKIALEPHRVEYAISKLTELGFEVNHETDTTITIMFNDSMVKLFPYTGWFTGKTVKDGRGIDNLIKQLKQ
jgi:hypothetical protein